MAGPGENSLVNGGVLSSRSPQHSADQHFVIYSTTPPGLDTQESSHCDAFCQPLHHSFLADFTDVQGLHECGDAQRFQENFVGSGLVAGGNGSGDRLSARRIHKADREKLRRDKLNEQFSELASALDPDRPKNDKATILGESVQVVKDLREEVKRLKTEHTSLLNESRDLTQEKNELREEKAALKTETEQLQSQLQQRLRTSTPWMALDPSMVMGAAAFPYPVPVPQPVSLSQSDSHQGPPRALVTPTPYMPLAPPLGTFHMHPSLQAYAMFGNRPGDAGNPFMPYPTFPPPVNAHSHIERPYAQYPSPVQPVPGYVVQLSPNQGHQSQLSPPSSGAPVYRPCVPGIPVVSGQNNELNQRSKESSHHSPGSQCNSQLAQSDSDREASGTVASGCQVEASGSPVIQDTMAEPQSLGLKPVGSEMQQGNSPVSTSIVTATFPVKEKLKFSLDQSGLLLDTDESRLAEKASADFGKGSELEMEQGHDPTLRPPAA